MNKLLLAIAAICITQPACALVINIAPNGNPKATLAEIRKNTQASVTLARALDLLKSPDLRNAAGVPKEPITLQLQSGAYRLNESLKLDIASSGSAEHPVLIQGPKDGSAIITGGKIVNDFSPVTAPAALVRLPRGSRTHVLQADLPAQGITDYGVQSRHGFGSDAGNPAALEITYRNQPMTLARWPNQGFATIASTPNGEKGVTFTVQGANLAAWAKEPDLLATGYWFNNWTDTTLPIKSVNPTNKRITLTVPKPPYGIKAGQRIFIQNALSELDQPGEWYLDTDSGMLYVWLPDATKIKDTFRQQSIVEASLLEKLLVIENAHYINLNNLTFQSARGDAITVQGGHHITIAKSTIRNIGNRAAVISGQDNGLTSMLIENIGEGAIVLQGGDRQTLTPANLYAERSTIRRFARISRTYQSAILLTGVGNRAVGNTISDSAHTAILFTGNDHLISQNEIFNVCQETGDAGAIYTGRDWTARGTIIAQNHLHDIPSNISWGKTKGVYLDDQASGMVVSGNRFENIYEAVFIGGGRDNLVEGNTFSKTKIAIHLDARGKKWKRATSDELKDTLQKRLEAVPYNQTPYKDRYPHLATILVDDPEMPKYNIARKNQISAESQLVISKDAKSDITVESASRNNTIINAHE